MEEFSGKILDVFNIRGRGTIIALEWDGIGTVSVGDILKSETGEELRIKAIEMINPLNGKIGLGISKEFDKVQLLKGKVVVKL